MLFIKLESRRNNRRYGCNKRKEDYFRNKQKGKKFFMSAKGYSPGYRYCQNAQVFQKNHPRAVFLNPELK